MTPEDVAIFYNMDNRRALVLYTPQNIALAYFKAALRITLAWCTRKPGLS